MAVRWVKFLVELVLFISFLFIGAAVFQALEYRDELSFNPGPNSSEVLSSVVYQINKTYNITGQDLNSIVEKLRIGLRNGDGGKWTDWGFAGSYHFAGTVAFTIGFGHQTPKTALGRLTVILYAMIAIPITALLLSTCGERLAEQQKKLVIFIERKLFKRPTHLKVKIIAMNVFVLILFMVIGCAMTKYLYDGWTILEGIYFLWICLTTVGFGDYIVNDGKPNYRDQPFKTATLRFNILLLVFGLCQVSCILVSIQNMLETNVVGKVRSTKEDNGTEEDTKEAKDNTAVGKSNPGCEVDIENIDKYDKKLSTTKF